MRMSWWRVVAVFVDPLQRWESPIVAAARAQWQTTGDEISWTLRAMQIADSSGFDSMPKLLLSGSSIKNRTAGRIA
jgi:hypothetical protein